jgi:hypothetical protein
VQVSRGLILMLRRILEAELVLVVGLCIRIGIHDHIMTLLDQEGVDLFRGRNFSSVFSLPGAKDAPKSMELSLLTSKRVGLGRVYNVVPELNL